MVNGIGLTGLKAYESQEANKYSFYIHATLYLNLGKDNHLNSNHLHFSPDFRSYIYK